MDTFLKSLQDIQLGEITLAKLFSALLVLLVCLALSKLIMTIANRTLAKSKLEKGLINFIRSIIRIALWALSVLVAADTLGIPITTFVAVLSVAGVALSLSVQGILTNLFSGFTILTTKPFVAGDYVELGTTAGTVCEIGLFHTSVITPDNKHIFIPNGDITSSRIVNYSTEPTRRVDVEFNLPYEYKPEDVKAAVLDMISAESGILPDPAPEVRITGFADGGMKYVLRVWVENARYWDVYFAMTDGLVRTLGNQGLSMTYAAQNIRIVDKA